MIRLVIWPLLLLGFGAWAVSQYGVSDAAAAFAGADWGLVGLSFCLNIGMLYFRVFKWSLILGPVLNPAGPPFYPLCLAAFSGYLCNSILPARVGGLVQAWIAGKRAGPGFFPAMGSIALIRVLDGITLVALGILVLGALALSSLEWEGLGPMGVQIAGAAGGLLLAAALLWGLVRFKGLEAFMANRVLRLMPQRFRGRGKAAVTGFARGLALLKHPGSLALVTVLSFLFWIMCGTSVRLLLKAFDLGPGGYLPAFTLLLAQVFAMGIPAPANAGPYHGATIAVLSVYGIPLETAVMAAVAMHGVMTLSNALPGVVYAGYDGTRILNLYKEMKKGRLND